MAALGALTKQGHALDITKEYLCYRVFLLQVECGFLPIYPNTVKILENFFTPAPVRLPPLTDVRSLAIIAGDSFLAFVGSSPRRRRQRARLPSKSRCERRSTTSRGAWASGSTCGAAGSIRSGGRGSVLLSPAGRRAEYDAEMARHAEALAEGGCAVIDPWPLLLATTREDGYHMQNNESNTRMCVSFFWAVIRGNFACRQVWLHRAPFAANDRSVVGEKIVTEGNQADNLNLAPPSTPDAVAGAEEVAALAEAVKADGPRLTSVEVSDDEEEVANMFEPIDMPAQCNCPATGTRRSPTRKHAQKHGPTIHARIRRLSQA